MPGNLGWLAGAVAGTGKGHEGTVHQGHPQTWLRHIGGVISEKLLLDQAQTRESLRCSTSGPFWQEGWNYNQCGLGLFHYLPHWDSLTGRLKLGRYWQGYHLGYAPGVGVDWVPKTPQGNRLPETPRLCSCLNIKVEKEHKQWCSPAPLI